MRRLSRPSSTTRWRSDNLDRMLGPSVATRPRSAGAPPANPCCRPDRAAVRPSPACHLVGEVPLSARTWTMVVNGEGAAMSSTRTGNREPRDRQGRAGQRDPHELPGGRLGGPACDAGARLRAGRHLLRELARGPARPWAGPSLWSPLTQRLLESALEASSGRTARHRLNRGGDRALNSALHTIAMTRTRCCPRTKAYAARRSEGKSTREIRRCLSASGLA